MLPKVTRKLPIFPQRSELFIASKRASEWMLFFIRGAEMTGIDEMLGKGSWLVGREVSKGKEKMLLQALGWREIQGIPSSCGPVSVGLLHKRSPGSDYESGKGPVLGTWVPISGTGGIGENNVDLHLLTASFKLKKGCAELSPESH